MAHNLHRLAQTAWNVPHLIQQEALSPILEYLSSRLIHTETSFKTTPEGTLSANKAQKLGVVGEVLIDGPLTYKPVQAACAPEGCSYQGILAQVEYLISEGVDTIVLTHSSPGGEANHAFSTATDIRAMCDDAGVKLVSYIDTYSASASYLIACVADEVIIHPEASAGSIGCVVGLHDFSKAMEKEGIKTIYISSTPGKTPFAEDGSFSASFLEKIQEDVTRLGNKFAQHVSDNTGISFEDVLKMDAQMFHADVALKMGLVNKVMDHNQFASYLAEQTGK